MPNLTLPNVNVAIGSCKNSGEEVKVNEVWYQKLIEWLKKTNQDSLSTNGRLTVTATSDTNLRFSYRGSDDIVRTADITLVP